MPDREVSINIRDPETRLYESEMGDLFVETPSETYEVSIIGASVSLSQASVDTSEMEELEPADPEVEDVDTGGVTETEVERMD